LTIIGLCQSDMGCERRLEGVSLREWRPAALRAHPRKELPSSHGNAEVFCRSSARTSLSLGGGEGQPAANEVAPNTPRPEWRVSSMEKALFSE